MKEFLALPRGYEIEIGEVTVAFAAFLRASEAPALDRAVALDLLAVEARRAPEVASGLRLGLHPSVRFLAYGERSSILWRDPGGDVLRERVSLLTLALLARFREPVAPENIAARLAGLDLGWQWLQQTIEECTEAGILVHQ
jgi:hypothetical protein